MSIWYGCRSGALADRARLQAPIPPRRVAQRKSLDLESNAVTIGMQVRTRLQWRM